VDAKVVWLQSDKHAGWLKLGRVLTAGTVSDMDVATEPSGRIHGESWQ